MRFDSLKAALFAEAYTETGSATEAYSRVFPGCTTQSALTSGARFLKRPEVKEILDNIRKRSLDVAEVTDERIIKELACLAFVDANDLFHEDGGMKLLSEMPEDARRAINGIDVSFTQHGRNKKAKIHDKKGALELLARIRKMLVDRTEIKSENVHTVQHADLKDRVKAEAEGPLDPFS